MNRLCVYGGLFAILLIGSLIIFPSGRTERETPTDIRLDLEDVHYTYHVPIICSNDECIIDVTFDDVKEHIRQNIVSTIVNADLANITYVGNELAAITNLTITKVEFYFNSTEWVESLNYTTEIFENGSFEILAEIPLVEIHNLTFMPSIIAIMVFSIIVYFTWRPENE